MLGKASSASLEQKQQIEGVADDGNGVVSAIRLEAVCMFASLDF